MVVSYAVVKFMKRICLITHTEASHTVDRRVGGWFNSDLTVAGQQQAMSLRPRLLELGFNPAKLPVYSSDLNRAVQTAELLCESSKLNIQFDARLREMSFGENGGMPLAEHTQLIKFPPEVGNRLDHRICNGAESPRDLAQRTTEFVAERMTEAGDLIIVSHGFASSFVIAAFQNIAIESMAYIDYKLRAGSISVLEADDYFHNRSIVLLNG